MEKEKSKNLQAILIGFLLITAVTSITLLKSYRKEKEYQKKNIENIEKIVDETKKAKSISVKDLNEKLLKGEKIFVIDIRSMGEYQKEHLLNSTSMPLEKFEENISLLKKEYTYAIVDSISSLEVIDLAGNIMPKNGIENVFYLEGGFGEWKNNFLPTISEGDVNSFSDQSKIKYINVDEMKAFFDKEKNLLIIDVRAKDAYDAEHVRGSVNIFFNDIEKKIKEIPIGKKIIVYDDDSISAFKAAVRLFDLGKMNVLTLSERFGKWKEKGYPTEKSQ